jgi:hypothetical protein
LIFLQEGPLVFHLIEPLSLDSLMVGARSYLITNLLNDLHVLASVANLHVQSFTSFNANSILSPKKRNEIIVNLNA